MYEDEVTAMLLAAIWRLCEGDVSKFIPPAPVPEAITSFLGGRPPIEARRAALVAILQSIAEDEVRS